MLKLWVGVAIDVFGLISIVLILLIFVIYILLSISDFLNKTTKLFCKHEYKLWNVFFSNHTEYEFVCNKCGKVLTVNTINNDEKFWRAKYGKGG